MAKNPMQRKAQNSFLLGMLITLLITGIIIALLFVQLTKVNQEMKQLEVDKVSICVLKADIKSGQIITDDLVTTLTVDKNAVPSNAIGSDASILGTYRLEDSAGNAVQRAVEKDPNTGAITATYLYVPYIDATTGDVVTDQTTGEPKKRIIEENGENYYYQDNNQKVELTTVPIIAKVNMSKNTVLTSSLITKSSEKLTDDVRKVEYNMIVLPTQIETNSYIDIRLNLPNGKDFIVLSHKLIEIPMVEGIDSINTIWLNLNEAEILTLSCAIVESYKIEGSKLYITEYVEPGLQGAAVPTYLPDEGTVNLIEVDPNCLAEAKQALRERNNNQNNKVVVRNPINTELNNNQDNAIDNVIDKVEEEIKKRQEERQKYLDSMGGSSY